MKLAIVRTSPNALDTKSYNIQEIGLAKGLLNWGISTDFYSIFKDVDSKEKIAFENNCEINLIPIKGSVFFGRITYFPKLINLLLENNYDMIQVHEDSQFMTPLILKKCRKKGMRTILYQGMYENYQGLKYLYQYFFDIFFKKMIQENADIIFAKTSLAKEYLEEKGYINISILPVGLDAIEEKKNIDLEKKLEEFNLKYDKILLYVGKIEERRNPFFLIDVLSLLSKENDKIGLIVVGEGPLYPQMIHYAEEKRVKEKLFSIDSIPNNQIHEIYKKSSVFLLPTNYEIYGMVVMEALSNGIPVVATPEAGPLSILVDERLGICSPLEIEKWTRKISEYIGDTSVNNKIFRKETIEKQYNWNTIAEKYYEIIMRNENSLIQ